MFFAVCALLPLTLYPLFPVFCNQNFCLKLLFIYTTNIWFCWGVSPKMLFEGAISKIKMDRLGEFKRTEAGLKKVTAWLGCPADVQISSGNQLIRLKDQDSQNWIFSRILFSELPPYFIQYLLYTGIEVRSGQRLGNTIKLFIISQLNSLLAKQITRNERARCSAADVLFFFFFLIITPADVCYIPKRQRIPTFIIMQLHFEAVRSQKWEKAEDSLSPQHFCFHVFLITKQRMYFFICTYL